jgi:tetratricopeptide (TPR) repeat protein
LISTYPDFFPSYYNYALYAWLNENRYDRPIEVATRGLSQKNPAFGVLHYLIGTLELGREAYEPAQEHLQQAKALGADASGWVWAMLHGARRDFPAADLAVQSFKTSGVPSNDLFGHVVAAAVQADRGDLPAAGAALESAAVLAVSAGPPYERLLALIKIELDELAGADVRGDLLPRLSALVAAESVAAAEGASAGASHAAFILGWSAATAWRWDEPELARSARSHAASLLEGRYHPVATQMLAVADAQQALQERRPEDGLKLLASLEDDSALVAVRALRVELLAAGGRNEEAIQVAEQLATARGRAYTEYGTLYSRSLRNVIDTNLAHLRIAELAVERGDVEASTRALAEFSRIWPEDRWPPAIRDRIRRMR